MIFYFSATGNNKYVAEEIAEKLGDQAVSIQTINRKSEYKYDAENNQYLGFVFPTYFYGLPTIVLDFLSHFKLDAGNPYTFMVVSYGTSPGSTDHFARRALKTSGVKTNAFYSIKMPDSWTPEFDLSNKDAVQQINDGEPAQIKAICDHILKRDEGNFMKDKHSLPVSCAAYQIYDKAARKTKNFHVEDTCIGCGLCAKKCPDSAIEMLDGKPGWVKDKCIMCAGCMHRCPKFAIKYKNKTQKHGQYKHPGVKVSKLKQSTRICMD